LNIQFQRRLTKTDLQDIVAVLLIAVGVVWLIFTPWGSLWNDDASASVTFFMIVIPGVLVTIGGISLLSVFSKNKNTPDAPQASNVVKSVWMIALGTAGLFVLTPFILLLCAFSIIVFYGIATSSEFRSVMMDGLGEKPIVTISAFMVLGVVLIGLCWLGYWRIKRKFLLADEAVRGAPKYRSLPLRTRIFIIVFMTILFFLYLSEKLGMFPSG
jgi:hypothetical protein